MRKFAWLTALAVAALFFGAPNTAFAHPNHHHQEQVEAPAALNLEAVYGAADHVLHSDEFVSAAPPQQAQVCVHGALADCETCCGCSGHASIALLSFEHFDGTIWLSEIARASSSSLHIRQTADDLSDPPKSFA